MTPEEWQQQQKINQDRYRLLRMWGAYEPRRGGRRPTPQETIAAQMMAQDQAFRGYLTPESAMWGSPLAGMASTNQYRAQSEREADWYRAQTERALGGYQAQTARHFQIPAGVETERLRAIAAAQQALAGGMPAQLPPQPPFNPPVGMDPTAIFQQRAAMAPTASASQAMIQHVTQLMNDYRNAVQQNNQQAANQILQALIAMVSGRPPAPMPMPQ
jgi:hypothetical protein